MGCGPSKEDDLPLVIHCRERKALIRAAANHRYGLAAAHVAYFRSLVGVGDALFQFIDEELLIPSPSVSPVLSLPSDIRKGKKKNKSRSMRNYHTRAKTVSSSSISLHSGSRSHVHISDEDRDTEFDASSGHIHLRSSPRGKDDVSSYSSPPSQSGWRRYGAYPEMNFEHYGSYPMNPFPQSDWNQYATQSTTYTYYMKRYAPQVQSIIYDPKYSYFNSYSTNPYENQKSKRSTDPPPPPPPKGSAWDFFNPFDGYNSGYPGYTYGSYAYGSVASSPDLTEVREREGIPDLEDETESEVYKQSYKRKNPNNNKMRKKVGKQYKQPIEESSGVSSREALSEVSDMAYSADVKEVRSSPDTVSKSTEDGSVRKKGVTFEVERPPIHNIDASRLSNFTKSSARNARDLKEAVAEIRDEFSTASGYGKEVAMLLEVGKLPHQPKFALLRAPSSSSSHHPSRRSVRFSYRTMKLAKAYYDDSRKTGMKPGKLSLTLEKLYVWEKKLYKEVKDEERLRVIYDRQCKRLKVMDKQGAEVSKIEAIQASIRKLHTKIYVCIRVVDSISRRIHKLRDEELHPQVSELIYGLIRMWRSMLKCHQQQFQAIMESKARSLRNINSREGSSLKATLELEVELRTWYAQFSNWITNQKSFVESLNGWLGRCIFYEPENTPDGVIPYSPGRIGAPQIFVISNDWSQEMESISEKRVARAMKNFASSLEKLVEVQGEQHKQRVKAEYFSKDFEKRLKVLRTESGKIDISDSESLVASDSGVSLMDDLKVDLDLIKKRWADSSSIQAGLIPIFEALRNFTSEALKAYEHVRIQNETQDPDVKYGI